MTRCGWFDGDVPRQLVLASASPARLGLLRAAGIDPDVVVSEVDERAVEEQARQEHGALSPAGLAQLLAEAKGADVAARLPGDDRLLLAGDSVLEIDGAVHGKPGTAQEATRRWRAMRGRRGVLHSGHRLIDLASGRAVGRPASAVVSFADLSDDEIEGYVATGEPLHVAGGFTLDGLGAPFVTAVEGHPSTVVGLSLPLLRELLAELDVPWWQVAAG